MVVNVFSVCVQYAVSFPGVISGALWCCGKSHILHLVAYHMHNRNRFIVGHGQLTSVTKTT